MPTRGIIAAVSPEGVIGLHGRIPWHYSADLKHFKRTTFGATIIMGRKTWESLGGRALPGRRNLVITSQALAGVETFPTIAAALATCEGTVWFVGGRGIYEEAMPLCDTMDITHVPDRIDDPAAVTFPPIDAREWRPARTEVLEGDERLTHTIYQRRRKHKA